MSQEKKKKEKDPQESWFSKFKSMGANLKHWHRKSIERGRHDKSGRK